MGLIHKIKNNNQLSRSEQILRKYILANKNLIFNMNTDEIAKCNYVSKSTLTRFAKKMGFSGWNEFKLQFVKEISFTAGTNENICFNYPFMEKNDISDIANNLFSLKKNTLSHLFSSIDLLQIEKTLPLIKNKNRIHIFAEGYSLLASHDFCFRMTRLGKVVTNNNDVGISYNALSLSKNDLAIVVSYTSKTREVVRAFNILIKNAVPIISITSEDANDFRNESQISINIPREEDIYSKIGNYSTVDSIRTVFDLIYSCFVADNPMLVMQRIHVARKIDKKI
ncbi:MAG: MurR/RpiR family transcriptional regulator [Breznakia sp.]